MPRVVSQPFELKGKPVRIVSYDWRADSDYAEAEAEGIVDVYQVTWSESDDPLSGWVANIQQLDDGAWTVGDTTGVAYATAEDAALNAVLGWIAYESKLTQEDYERLFETIVPALAMPGVKPPPRDQNTLKRRLMR